MGNEWEGSLKDSYHVFGNVSTYCNWVVAIPHIDYFQNYNTSVLFHRFVAMVIGVAN
jgi:hypothetical protein